MKLKLINQEWLTDAFNIYCIIVFFYTNIFINIFNTAMAEQEWEYVPPEAFLYFPAGEEVKSGF